jgi:hypothetical protein
MQCLSHGATIRVFRNRLPPPPGYKQRQANAPDEFYTFEKFRSEFARLFGQYRRGRSFHMWHLDPEKDSDYLHSYYLNFGKRK